MNCSDYSTAWVCRTCGSLISLGFDELRNTTTGTSDGLTEGYRREYCRICEDREAVETGMAHGHVANGTGNGDVEVKQEVGVRAKGSKGKGEMDVIAVPYVFRYVSCSARRYMLWTELMK